MKPIYNILSLQKCGNGYSAQVSFDPEHIIYKAHFPNNPITPGVILLQICKECVMRIIQLQEDISNVIISNIKMIKFTNFIIPQTGHTINITIQQTDNIFKTTIFDNEKEYAKMQFTI